MTKTIYKNYSLKELCVTYLEFLNLWHTGVLYSNRAELHDEICERLGIAIYDRSEDIPLNRILHNLDKEIGYVIGVKYDKKDIEKMGKRLCNKLKKGSGYLLRGGTKKMKWIKKWNVESESGNGSYVVSLSDKNTWGCSCPVWKFRRQECKHIKRIKAEEGY